MSRRPTKTGPGQSVYRPGGTVTSRKTTFSNQSRVGRSNFASSRSVAGGSAKKANIIVPDKFTDRARYLGVVVLDEAGNDVTPKPLVLGDAVSNKGQRSNIFGADSSGTATPSDISPGGGGGGSIYQNQGTYQSVFTAKDDEKEEEKSTGSFSDDWFEPAEMASIGLGDIRHVQRSEAPEVLSAADLDAEVTLTLTETDCDFLFDLQPVTVHMESDEAQHVRERNSKYAEEDPKAKLVRSRVGNDRYTERWMQTINEAPKIKSIQTDKINFQDVGCTATTWDMYDTYKSAEEENKNAKVEEDEDEDLMAMAKPKQKSEEEEAEEDAQGVSTPLVGAAVPSESLGGETRSSTMTSTISDSVFGRDAPTEGEAPVQAGPKAVSTSVLKKENFRRDLFVMERVVNLNTYQPRLAAYRGFPVIADPDRAEASVDIGLTLRPNLDRLWVYGCSLTEGRTVSSMAWNKMNPDLIAVGYGQLTFGEQKGGMACCWSLKNPKYPERIFTNASGITAMDFSETHPNLLAVGLYDGSIVVYNVRVNKDEPVLDSFEVGGKHTSPVWLLRWIEKERGAGEERQEILVSISTDGRVTQWMIRKGFECSDLMKLKRIAPKPGFSITGGRREKKGEAFIARQAGGMCFDFSPKDSNLYLAGTEEGHIHKCSCSYNEQYLDTYWGHTGPVYRIQWSPFLPEVFLSCSGDWSMRLWQQDRMSPVINFFSGTRAVYDISWSPHVSTIFAAVNEGEVQIWDLSQNTLDPIIVQKPTSASTRLTTVTFARNSESVLVGDSEGQVTVYQLRGMPVYVKETSHQEEALNKILSSTLASQLAAQATKIKAEKKVEGKKS